MGDLLVPAREVFRHFPAFLVVAFYLIAFVALGAFVRGFWLRINKYRAGRPAHRLNLIRERILRAVRTIGGHPTLK